jgi:hypothetical protein
VPTKKTDEVVRYVGESNVRSISTADWKQAGVDHDKVADVVWDRANGYAVPKADLTAFLTEDQYNAYIMNDPQFKVERVEEIDKPEA